jgi:hypothetical protein
LKHTNDTCWIRGHRHRRIERNYRSLLKRHRELPQHYASVFAALKDDPQEPRKNNFPATGADSQSAARRDSDLLKSAGHFCEIEELD